MQGYRGQVIVKKPRDSNETDWLVVNRPRGVFLQYTDRSQSLCLTNRRFFFRPVAVPRSFSGPTRPPLDLSERLDLGQTS